MNVVIGIFVTVLVLAIWAESRRASQRVRRGNVYDLISYREEIRLRREREKESDRE